MQAALVLLVATAAVAAASRFGSLYGPAPAPETQECCQEGVPVCSQLSRRLGIPDLGCELLCLQRGHPGSLGCSYRPPAPACGCRSNHTATATPPQPGAELRVLPTGSLSRTRFS